MIKERICICVARLEWLKAGISTKIMLRPDKFQGLVHLALLTSAMDDSSEWLTGITSSEMTVLMNCKRMV